MDKERAIEAIAAELRAERAAQKISIRALAEESGIPEVSLNRYLSGARDVTGSALLNIASALGTDLGTILDRAALRAQREQD